MPSLLPFDLAEMREADRCLLRRRFPHSLATYQPNRAMFLGEDLQDEFRQILYPPRRRVYAEGDAELLQPSAAERENLLPDDLRKFLVFDIFFDMGKIR